MSKIEELEERIRELEGAHMRLKQEFKNAIYELDENNFSRNFLKKLGYQIEIKKEDE